MPQKASGSGLGRTEIGGAPAIIIVVVIVLLAVGFFLWRDHASTNAPSPNAFTPGQALPPGIKLPAGTKLPAGMQAPSPAGPQAAPTR